MVLGRALFQQGRASFLGPASEVAGFATLAVKIYVAIDDSPRRCSFHYAAQEILRYRQLVIFVGDWLRNGS